MRRVVVRMSRAWVPVIFFALAACTPASKVPNDPSTTPVDPNSPVSSPPSNDVPGAPPGEIPPGCNFRVKGECHADQKSACTAAGCADTCIVMESYPAQISCK